MNDDNFYALFKALLKRALNDTEKLRLYNMRDALPPGMRDSPSVLAELILQFDHAQRMTSIARNMEVSASKIAKNTMEETMKECLLQVQNTFSTAAAITIERVANQVERATVKRVQTEDGIIIPLQVILSFLGGAVFTLAIVLALNVLGLR